MKREADGDMGSPHKRYRRGDEEVRLLIPSKVNYFYIILFYVYRPMVVLPILYLLFIRLISIDCTYALQQVPPHPCIMYVWP